MKKWITIFLLSAGVITMSHFIESCRKNNVSGNFNPTSLAQVIPDGFPQPNYKFENNPLTEEGFQLGRKLFYDGRLSKDGNFACASCHQQFAAFATYDHDLSHGFHAQFPPQNAPPLFNLAWSNLFHWDGGVNHIEVQALSPMT